MKVAKDYLPSLGGLAGLLISVLRTVLAFHLKETVLNNKLPGFYSLYKIVLYNKQFIINK